MNPAMQFDSSALAFPTDTGYSPEAKIVSRLLDEALDHLSNTGAEGQRLQNAISALDDVYQECCEGNWDGYGAKAISEDAYVEAYTFLKLLPSDIPIPEFVPEPTGAIALEWFRGTRFVFVVSVSGESFITYAGLFGINKVHGTEYFADALPASIVLNIRRLYSYRLPAN